jgi:hypothetical protein
MRAGPRAPARVCDARGTTNEISSTIHSGLELPGPAPESDSGSLPYRTTPLCLDLSLSTIGFRSTQPKKRTCRPSCVMSGTLGKWRVRMISRRDIGGANRFCG